MKTDLEQYLNDIKSLTFNSISSRCTIELEDGSTLVYCNKNNSTDENVNKLASYNGAMDMVKRLCGERVQEQKTTVTENMDMSDVLYHFIGASSFTVKNLYDDLASSSFPNYSILQSLKSFLPVVGAGRQSGHTTAIHRFIADNRHMTFGIMVDKNSYIHDYKHHRNAYHIRTDNASEKYDDNSLRGVKLDYIIIDKYLSTGIDVRILKRLLYKNTSDKTKLVALGN